jgi:hypothetical protein
VGCGEATDKPVAAGALGSLCVARGDQFEVPWTPDARPLSDDPADTAWIGFTVALAEWSAGRLEAALEHAAEAVDEMYALTGSSDDFVHRPPWSSPCRPVRPPRWTGSWASSVRAHRVRFAGLVARRRDPAAAESQLRCAHAWVARLQPVVA